MAVDDDVNAAGLKVSQKSSKLKILLFLSIYVVQKVIGHQILHFFVLNSMKGFFWLFEAVLCFVWLKNECGDNVFCYFHHIKVILQANNRHYEVQLKKRIPRTPLPLL